MKKIYLFIIALFISSFVIGQTATFTSSGSWTCPAGVTTVTVNCWGAGGGGASRSSNGRAAGAGGGAFASSSVPVTPGTSYNFVVGTGGTAGVNGGATSFNTTTVVAAGGTGVATNSTTGGAGGTTAASTGTTKFAGGNGSNSDATYGGGGGGGAGTTGAGGAGGLPTGGTGAAVSGGNGGAGATAAGNGFAGNNYGGGGGGCRGSNTGGAGAGGYLTISYTCPTYSLTATSASSPINMGTSSTVTLTGAAANLPVGTYTVTYNLSAPNAATGNTATMTVSSAGTGTFTTSTLANIGATTITITNLSSGTGTPCANAIAANNTSVITVNGAYCTPAPTSVDGSGITNVTCGTINNTTGAEPTNYGDYSVLVTTVMQSTSVTVNITYSTGYTYDTKIWVDWNNDFDFADAGEEVYSGTSLAANPTTLVATFTVPAGASLGNHRMRIGGVDSGPPTYCWTSSYGTFEDYTLNVIALPACLGTPAGGTAVTSVSPICVGYSANLSITGGATPASGLSYQWQSSPNNATWTNIGGATSTTYTASPTTSTWYRMVTTCSNSGLSASSISVQVVVTAPSYATLPVNESFETWISMCGTNDVPSIYWKNTPVVGENSWRRDDQGADATWASPASYVYSPVFSDGAHSARFHSGSSTAGLQGSLDLYVNCTPAGTKSLMFDVINTSGTDVLTVLQSTDGGATFPTTLGTYGVIAAWTTQTINITSTNATTVIRFRSTADYGSTDIGLDYVRVLLPCTGTPTAGTVIATPNSVCPGSSSVLTLSGYTVAGGITFQWQSAAALAGPYSNIGGATANTYTASPATNTYYRCVVTCSASGLTANTTGVLVTVLTPTYAALPVVESFESWQSRCGVNDVPTVSWLNSPVTGENSWRRDDQGADGGWGSPSSYVYSPVSTDGVHSARFHSGSATAGLQGKLDLYVNCSPAGNKTLMFDVINTSGTDVLTVLQSTDGGATFPTTLGTYAVIAAWTTQTITVTSTSATTVLRFRATADYGSTDIGLDYVRLLLPCTGTPTAGNAVATPSVICAGGSSVLSLSGASVAGGLTYQWQSSPDNSTWTNIGGATAVTYTATPAATTYYRCKVTCSTSTLFAFSASAQVSITAGPSYATLPVSESFEGPWLSWCNTRELPTNNWANTPNTGNNSWRRDDDGAAGAWGSPTSYIYSPVSSHLSHSARFHSGSATAGLQGKLDLYVNCSPAGTKTMFFDIINTSGTDVLTVQQSTDGGATFPTTLGTYAVVGAWTTQSINITSVSATTVIRFMATADYGSTDIGLDNLLIVMPCTGTPTAGTASSNISSFCNTGTPTLTVTGYSIAGGLTFQWQSSPSNSPYVWSDIIGGTTTVFTAPSVAQTTYYRCRVSCGGNYAYTAPITVTNDAQTITGTNSPITVVCNNAATMTATASGGTVYWYSGISGGSPLASGNSYSPVVTANTTYYCAAGNGGTNYMVGKPTSPLSDGYYGSTNVGLVFDAFVPFTLVSVNVYNQTAGSTVSIQLQDNTGLAIGAPVNFTNCPAGLNTLTLNLSIPIGNDYRLVSANTTNLGRDFSGSYPYTQAGICSITDGYISGTSSSYYFFYNWVISTGCESSPRTPVDVIVSGGVSAPLCSNVSAPVDGTTGVCPVATTLAWTGSTTACQAATGYKLYVGTNATADNIVNGLNVGNVTSYNLGTITGSTLFYWKVVPTNTAGDASGCPTWTFTTAANPGAICAASLGTGVTIVGGLPYATGAGTTAGMGNDLTSTNTVTCGSTSYTTGEDMVWVFTPAASGTVTITLTSTGTYTGLTVYDGCPLSAGACGAAPGSCIAYAQTSTGDKTLIACVTAGVTYYLVLDSYSTPFNNPFSSLSISAPSGVASPANDLPCNAQTILMGDLTPGDNACTSGSGEPSAPSCWTNGVINTVWFKFQAPASGTAKIKTMVGTLLNTQIAVYSGTCGTSMTLVACNDNVAACGTSSYYNSELSLTGLVPGNWYYIVVDGYDNLTGTFSLVAVDGSAIWPPVPGQDCVSDVPVCATTFTVGNPGYQAVGNNCDFGTNYCLLSGERGSAWYEIKVTNAGNLMFTIEPNDVVPPIGTAGVVTDDGTDYDFALWKKTGAGAVSCADILAGTAVPLACNYSYIGVTGLYTGGNSPTALNAYTNHTYTSGAYDAAFEPPVAVTAGDSYWLVISNFSNSLSGFTINFTGSTNTFNFTVPNPLIWTGGASNSNWFDPRNWGNCVSIPDSTIDCIIAASSVYQPNISAAGANCRSITINPSATLTISGGFRLDIHGNYNNQGNLNTLNNSTVMMKGSAVQTMDGIMVDPSDFSNLTINKTGGSVITQQHIDCSRNFRTLNATSVMNMNNNDLNVGLNFFNANGNATFIPGTGTLFFDGANAQTYTNTAGVLTLNNVTMIHTGTGVTIANDMNLGASGVLTLTSGKIITNAFRVNVANTAPAAVTTGNTTSFVQGNLRRYLQPTGSYDFPVGDATKGYQRANFNFTSASSITYLTARFDPYAIIPAALGNTECGATYNMPALDNGYWTVTANANPNSGKYTCTLYNLNYTNATGATFCTVMSDHTGGGYQLLNGDLTAGTCVACPVTAAVRQSMDGFSKFGTALSNGGPLPIELLSFTGKALDDVNLLEWATATEVNNEYFVPEKSSDGINFVEMTRVAGAGNSNRTLWYDQLDETPFSPVTYYKLKQVDYDGQYTYSDIIAIARENGGGGAEIVNVYPNPASTLINIELFSPVDGFAEIEIVDIFGRTIMQRNNAIKKGTDIVIYDISPLATGVYFTRIKFVTSGNSSVKRFVKQ